MLLRVLRFVVTCGDCRAEFGEDHPDGPRLFFTEADARDTVTADATWECGIDGVLRCGVCAGRWVRVGVRP